MAALKSELEKKSGDLQEGSEGMATPATTTAGPTLADMYRRGGAAAQNPRRWRQWGEWSATACQIGYGAHHR